MVTRGSPYSRSFAGMFSGRLTASPVNMLQWASKDGLPEQLVVSVNLRARNSYGSGTLPRMSIRYGHARVDRIIEADLATCTFPLIASSVTINVYHEVENPAGSSGDLYEADAIIGLGDCQSQLVWTAPRRAFNPPPAGYVSVNPVARRARVIAGSIGPNYNSGVNFPYGCYLSFLSPGVYGDPAQTIPFERAVDWIDIGAQGGRNWNHICMDTSATASALYFRAQFGLL